MVKNLPYNAGDAGSIPGPGTKIPHPMGQLACRPQLESPCPAKILRAATMRGLKHPKKYIEDVRQHLCVKRQVSFSELQFLASRIHMTIHITSLSALL